jgi:outer membrane immunogenic protein
MENTMKKFLLAAVGVVALSASASAADLAARPYTKAPPMVVAAYDWSGFYIGINGGGGWGRKCWDQTFFGGAPVVPSISEGCHNPSGGTVGGQVGYRWQSAAWVFGLEAQGNWADFNGSNTIVLGRLAGSGDRTKIDAFGLFTGQVGYSWNQFLLYVKGGAAVVSDKYEGYNIANGVAFDSAKETRLGAVVGVGGEYAITRNLSVALEYDHMFMGRRSIDLYSTTVPGLLSRTDSIRQDVDLFTARLNYRWGGPVVAKY